MEIVIIGGGPAAVAAALEAKLHRSDANVTLVTEEACEPYEKPPLSKGVLLGQSEPNEALIAGPNGLASQGISVRLATRCEGIDRAARKIVTNHGDLPFDALVIATGSLPRELPNLPLGMDRVHYLRTQADARALRGALLERRRIAIIGAGLIGLEVAASAAELGLAVTVFEAAPRVMARACCEEIGMKVLAEHRRRGVEVRLETMLRDVSRQDDGSLRLTTADGDVCLADHVVIGTGVTPNDALAAGAKLKTDDGILIDEGCRTSDPAIFAGGDCTRFPGPDGMVRLENWRHALDHGGVAGRNAAGAQDVYRAVPSFWSEQYDLYIQGVGWADPEAVSVTRPLEGNSSLIVHAKDGRVCGATGINVQRDIAMIRRLIERNIPIDSAALADPDQPFAAMLKVKA
ncbi:NAD(P)/FAD-dependent oxidoreductase [Oricola indica]|uniref:NAD(P)/FAD-dependent oxidoreductase n=1 Tax=Oricola indica TaxID=2872591 RepID=UPI003CCBEA8C